MSPTQTLPLKNLWTNRREKTIKSCWRPGVWHIYYVIQSTKSNSVFAFSRSMHKYAAGSLNKEKLGACQANSFQFPQSNSYTSVLHTQKSKILQELCCGQSSEARKNRPRSQNKVLQGAVPAFNLSFLNLRWTLACLMWGPEESSAGVNWSPAEFWSAYQLGEPGIEDIKSKVDFIF